MLFRSAWNVEGRLQGQANVPLSDHGLEQVRSLAPLVRSFRPATAIASDLRRAAQTAEVLGYMDATLDPRLRELSLGEWEGRTMADLQSTEPAAYAAWRSGTLVPPGGEAPDAMFERVRAAIEDALAAPSPVLVVSHGGIVRAALDLLLDLDTSRLVAASPASLTVVDVPDGVARVGAYAGAKLHSYNVTAT